MWITIDRPGYFGRKRDEKIAALNAAHGEGKWRLAWITSEVYAMTFFTACRYHYEGSYYNHFMMNPQEVDFVCQFCDCYDNALSNIQSGLDYMVQESYSTHIQDIAVRNVLRRMDRWFTGANGKLLQIRSKDSEGFRYGPGNVPYFQQNRIAQESLCPKWASKGSVEDFWQSNKFLQVWRT